jgi:5'-deoxynucleotidase YfbR-like HD superfamily hydrolase
MKAYSLNYCLKTGVHYTISITEAKKTIHLLLEKGLVNHEKLKRYIQLVLKNLTFHSYNEFKLIEDLYNNKYLPRTGWVERIGDRGKRIESVAEHTYGTQLIALLLLQDAGNEKGQPYDKQKVLDILFIHDLAEAFTGDIINKTQQQQQNEKDWMSYISLTGTYYQMPETNRIWELFSEYDILSTEGQIAKDIDKLETIFQAYIYRRQGLINDTDLDEFKSTNLPMIKTNTVKHIHKILLQYVEMIGQEGTEYLWPKETVPVVPVY